MGVCSDRDTKRPGQSKVSQFDHALAADEDVLWFEVSVQHTVGVTEGDAIQHLVQVALQGGGRVKNKKLQQGPDI